MLSIDSVQIEEYSAQHHAESWFQFYSVLKVYEVNLKLLAEASLLSPQGKKKTRGDVKLGLFGSLVPAVTMCLWHYKLSPLVAAAVKERLCYPVQHQTPFTSVPH